ncbi:di-heme oxidoredictase family protein [Phaeovulum sp.]|uniref:di-heme oxidoreductase family protein n=1 Tax=Phaeovulum sp. TaxID=2934796 RepID=UPI0039E3220E
MGLRRAIALGRIPFAWVLALCLWAATGAGGTLGDGLPRTEGEAARIRTVIAAPTGFATPEPYESLPGGAATLRGAAGPRAFSAPAAGLTGARALDFRLGEALFGKLWVTAPSTTRASDGLGPLFNARSCASCHPGNGRGHAPTGSGPQPPQTSLVLKLSVPARADQIAAHLSAIPGWHAALPDPALGTQLQDRALAGLRPEGRVDLRWTTLPVELAGGETVTLRQPHVSVAGATGLAPGAQTSARVAPQLIGLGLLEAIPADEILARADPDDADGDGISGRAAWGWSRDVGQMRLGRFGHKAASPTLRDMVASAFSQDLGLSTPLYPDPAGDCTATQTACLAQPTGVDPGLRDGAEVGNDALDLVTLYAASLAVPERRAMADAQVLRGKALFHTAGCAICHAPKSVTARLPGQPERSFQLIWPYTDLLLHDIGPGLADKRPEGTAFGGEWRTAPLWGIGLTKAVTGLPGWLHDGRARTLLEAVLWHGGEAQAARDTVAEMPPDDRAALIQFLESL